MSAGDMIGIIIPSVISLSLIIVGIFLLKGKGSFLIAGYNTMTKAEKERDNKKALCRFVGIIVIIVALCMPITFIGANFEITWLMTTGIVSILIICFAAVVYALMGNRFRK